MIIGLYYLPLNCFFYYNYKIDYERRGETWNKMIRSSLDDWNRNLETIVQWSPYTSEEDLLHQVCDIILLCIRFLLDVE